jgi:cytochrome c oxidase cbb3-type subunit 3
LKEEYNDAMKAYQEGMDRLGNTAQVETEETLTQYMKSELAVTNGAGIFSSKCAMCHGENLEGKIGPNLTDVFWTTGDGSRIAIVRTITKGSGAKGMPSWEAILKPKEIKDVASYVYSKIGSNPANAKPAEGQEAKK